MVNQHSKENVQSVAQECIKSVLLNRLFSFLGDRTYRLQETNIKTPLEREGFLFITTQKALRLDLE